MRYVVYTRWGYASFSEEDEDQARTLYAEEGFRLCLCVGFHDEGIVIEGLPLGVDIEPTKWAKG